MRIHTIKDMIYSMIIAAHKNDHYIHYRLTMVKGNRLISSIKSKKIDWSFRTYIGSLHQKHSFLILNSNSYTIQSLLCKFVSFLLLVLSCNLYIYNGKIYCSGYS